jgi:PAS domain S-box-containing protein/putative nucleotidyltransferase with HDIG domain
MIPEIRRVKFNSASRHEGLESASCQDRVNFDDAGLIEGKYAIRDLVDIDRIKEIFEKFAAVTGFTIGLFDHGSQEVLVASSWREICTKFHRAQPASAEGCRQSNASLTGQLEGLQTLNIQRCDLGLIDGATPIVIQGKHLANLVAGQVFFEEPDRDRFRRQAESFGYDRNAYLQALSEVPVVNEARFREALSLLGDLAVMIAEQGLNNLELRQTTARLKEEIAERQRVGGALLKSRETCRALLDATPESVVLLDPYGVVLALNAVAARRMGKSIKELVGTCIYDLWPQEVAEKRKEVIEQAVRSKQLQRFMDYRQGRCYEHYLRPIPNEAGEIEELAVLAIDTTEHKQAEADLKLKERLLDGASDSIFLHDLDGRLLYVNEAAYKSRGYAKEELLANDNAHLAAQEYVDQRARLVEELQEKGDIIFDSAHFRKDGSIMPVEVHARLMDLGDRKLILSVTRDITARWQAEDALRASEEKFRQLIKNLPAVVFLGYADGCADLFDDKIADLTGYSQQEFNTRRRRWLDLILPEDQPQAKEKFLQALKGEKSYVREYRIRTRDRRILWLQERSHIVCSAEGKIRYINGVLFDITERKQAEERIGDLNILLKSITEINEDLLRVKSESQLFQSTCDRLIGIPYVQFAWIGVVSPDSLEVTPAAWTGAEDDFLFATQTRWDDSHSGQGAMEEAIRNRKPVIRSRRATDPGNNPWRKEAVKRELRSSITLPLIHEDETIGILAVYSGVPDAFLDEEVTFLSQVAGNIAVGIRGLRLAQGLEESLKRLQVMVQQTVETISAILEMRDPYTAGHQEGVTRLACAIAAEMGMEPDRIEGLRVAGFLHDIGKITVPAEFLNKPGKLSQYEFNIIKTHCQAGYDILCRIEFPWPVASIVLQHHERLDGSGYPAGLSGADICLEARILALADVVEAMASHRPYRPALGLEEALGEITKNKGKLYDPEVVDVCLQLLHEKGFGFN